MYTLLSWKKRMKGKLKTSFQTIDGVIDKTIITTIDDFNIADVPIHQKSVTINEAMLPDILNLANSRKRKTRSTTTQDNNKWSFFSYK